MDKFNVKYYNMSKGRWENKVFELSAGTNFGAKLECKKLLKGHIIKTVELIVD